MQVMTKEEIIRKLLEIREMGWVPNKRPGNDGGVGNTLEDLLGIEENNLPIPNAGEWEIKAQRLNTSSLLTLFHLEPSPRCLRLVPKMLLPKYGWLHDQAGKKYPEDERSFRQTITAVRYTDRGFRLFVEEERVVVSFSYEHVDKERHAEWLDKIKEDVGLGELSPQPYWGIDELCSKAGTKLHNCFLVLAKTKRIEGKTYYWYCKIMMLEKFSRRKFVEAIKNGIIRVDFDARTGHNHGTKFRMYERDLPSLYERVKIIASC